MKKLFIKMMPAVLILLMTCPMSWSASPKSITVSWQPSITNEDGTPCTDLAGYKIYYDKDKSGVPYDGIGIQEGDSPILLPLSIFADPAKPEVILNGLTSGTYYLVVTAYDTSVNESGYSNEINPFVDTTAPAAPSGMTYREIIIVVP